MNKREKQIYEWTTLRCNRCGSTRVYKMGTAYHCTDCRNLVTAEEKEETLEIERTDI